MHSYTIIDAHAHIFPQKIAEKATQNIGAFYDLPMRNVGSSDVLEHNAASIGAKKILVCSTATRETQVESINNFICEECRAHDKFVGLATLHPDYPEYERELDRIMEIGLHGVKLHSDFQKFDIDDPRMFPMYKAICDRKLPILFHTGDSRYEYSAPHRLRVVADRFPDLICIGAHFGGYERWDESAQTLKDCENVLFDTSSTLDFISREEATHLVHYFGAHRFMFGTDFPMWNHTDELERFLALDLTEEERERILHGTFEEYFH